MGSPTLQKKKNSAHQTSADKKNIQKTNHETCHIFSGRVLLFTSPEKRKNLKNSAFKSPTLPEKFPPSRVNFVSLGRWRVALVGWFVETHWMSEPCNSSKRFSGSILSGRKGGPFTSTKPRQVGRLYLLKTHLVYSLPR